jgi:hypothetical protein
MAYANFYAHIQGVKSVADSDRSPPPMRMIVAE